MKKKVLLTTALLSLSIAAAIPANSTVLTYNLNYEFSTTAGDMTTPEGGSPWVTMIFDDKGNSGTVDLTIKTIGLVEEEILSDLYFNFDTDNFNINNLVITPASGNTAIANSISKGINAFKADGAGYFDININFPPPGEGTSSSDKAASFFGANETIVYTLSLSGITASSFDFLSTSSEKGMFGAAAHIQRIDSIGTNSNDQSGWIAPKPIPEPTVTMLFALGVAGFAGMVRRNVTKR